AQSNVARKVPRLSGMVAVTPGPPFQRPGSSFVKRTLRKVPQVMLSERRPILCNSLPLDVLNFSHADTELIGDPNSRWLGRAALVLKFDQCAEYFLTLFIHGAVCHLHSRGSRGLVVFGHAAGFGPSDSPIGAHRRVWHVHSLGRPNIRGT